MVAILDLLKGIVDIITNILDFFQGLIETVTGFVSGIQDWWETMLTLISIMPDSVVGICIAAFLLLVSFVVVEILRDFL